ncbi:hypothetical protein C8F01DRAFT_1120295 [Mycena amicta]|nr:hypothetical protein C8F01DRAFT_1120295 [Mycena amicta]
MSPTTAQLLKFALPLIPQYGFTRAALSRSVLHLPPAETNGEAHTKPLSDAAVSALFGNGERARKTLINAWLDAGVESMAGIKSEENAAVSIRDVLHVRLGYNEPVLVHLPEHSARIADEACYISGDQSTRLSWYARRASLMGVYSAAELHQLTSPSSAHAFLDSLLNTSKAIESSVSDVGQFSEYVLRSWAGIARSRGLL